MTTTNGEATNGAGQPWTDMTAAMAEFTARMAQMTGKAYEETEKLWTGPIQEFMGTEFFVKWLETGREAYLHQVDLSRESLEQYWAAVRLPHKGDFASLAGQIVTVENKVDALEDQVDSVKSRLGMLEHILSRIESKLDQLATSAVTPAVGASPSASKGQGKASKE